MSTIDQTVDTRRAIAAELAQVRARLEAIGDALPTDDPFLREKAVQARVELAGAVTERLVDDLVDPRNERRGRHGYEDEA